MKKYLLVIVLVKITLLCSAQFSIGVNQMLTVSYNSSDGSIPIRPAKKSFIHLKYIKGQYNAEAFGGFNFYETLNSISGVRRQYYTDFGLTTGTNVVNNEKYCFQINFGVYHRTYADEDLAELKKPTRWGLIGVLGYQLKLNEKISTGIQMRSTRDFISNIDRNDQYKIQHLGLSFFIDINLAAIPEAFKNLRKKKN